MDAEQTIKECRAVLEAHSKSFAMAARLLPPEQRDAAAVVYAWCRRADDAIDEVDEGAQPAALEQLLRELDAIETGSPTGDLFVDAFAAIRSQTRMPLLYPRELIAGMGMDVRGQHYETLDDLLLYCHRVAGVVGLMMCHVMGVREDAALHHAAHLGWAMQLTNICRDVDEDWRRGRLYLPADMLRAEGVVVDLGGALPQSEPIGRVVRTLLATADALYRSGDEGLRDLSIRNALAVDVARRVYSSIGTQIAAQGYDVRRGRAYVSTPRKLLRVGLAVWARTRELPTRALVRDTYRAPSVELTFEEVRESYARLVTD